MTQDEYELNTYLKQQSLINKYADIIRELYNINVPVTNIDDIVSKIGGIVKYDSRCYGYVEKKKNEFIIHVADNKDYRIKNFSVAQQLGKIFLYTDFVLDRNKFFEAKEINFKDSYFKQGSIDWANEFAGAFIMPKDEFRKEVNKHIDGNTIDTKEVAKYFDVTVSTASWRGKRLGLFKD